MAMVLHGEAAAMVERAVAILRGYGATEVYVFGSVGTADFDPSTSDVDLAVRGIVPGDFYAAVGEILCSLGRPVDVVDLDAGTAFGKYLDEHAELSRVA